MPSGLESNRQIVIPVEVPSVSFLHTVRLRIDFTNCESQVPDALAAVGQVIPATLMIKHTRGWDTSNAAGNAPHGEEKPVEFSYEVQANPDSWLIAGRRRGHFHAKVRSGAHPCRLH